MRFLFVLVKYYWFNWSIRKNESVDLALLKSKIAVFCLFYLYAIAVILLLDFLFKTNILNLLTNLIPGESYFRRKIIPAIILSVCVYIIQKIYNLFPNRKISPLKKEFNQYMSGEKHLTKKELTWIKAFLIFTILTPVLICIYLWIRVLVIGNI